jgi:hypothetical protein
VKFSNKKPENLVFSSCFKAESKVENEWKRTMNDKKNNMEKNNIKLLE